MFKHKTGAYTPYKQDDAESRRIKKDDLKKELQDHIASSVKDEKEEMDPDA